MDWFLFCPKIRTRTTNGKHSRPKNSFSWAISSSINDAIKVFDACKTEFSFFMSSWLLPVRQSEWRNSRVERIGQVNELCFGKSGRDVSLSLSLSQLTGSSRIISKYCLANSNTSSGWWISTLARKSWSTCLRMPFSLRYSSNSILFSALIVFTMDMSSKSISLDPVLGLVSSSLWIILELLALILFSISLLLALQQTPKRKWYTTMTTTASAAEQQQHRLQQLQQNNK